MVHRNACQGSSPVAYWFFLHAECPGAELIGPWLTSRSDAATLSFSQYNREPVCSLSRQRRVDAYEVGYRRPRPLRAGVSKEIENYVPDLESQTLSVLPGLKH